MIFLLLSLPKYMYYPRRKQAFWVSIYYKYLEKKLYILITGTPGSPIRALVSFCFLIYIFLSFFCDTEEFLSCSHTASHILGCIREKPDLSGRFQSQSCSLTCPSTSQGMERKGKVRVFSLSHGLDVLPGVGVLAGEPTPNKITLPMVTRNAHLWSCEVTSGRPSLRTTVCHVHPRGLLSAIPGSTQSPA